MAGVRVLYEMQVSPSPSLPSQPPEPLSFLDSIWLQASQVERVFFYDFPHPISHFIDHTLPTFTTSLSLALRYFYPLAGNIRPCSASEDQFEIVYTEGDSVTITVVEFIGEDFRDLSGYFPRNFNKLRLLVPKLTKSSSDGQFRPLSIQVTLFPNQGLSIGFTINHAVCDGFGLMQFIRSWAAACRSTERALDEIVAPLLDRSIIIDTSGIGRKLSEIWRRNKGKITEDNLKKKEALPFSYPSLFSATFTLGKEQIVRLKERLKAKSEEEGKPSFHLSAFVVTCAYVWRCLMKAHGYEGDKTQYFGCAVDWRSRMWPQIPNNYIGNCLGTFLTDLKAGDLVGKDGVEAAAMAIGKSIDGLQGTNVNEGIEMVFEMYPKLVKCKPLSVAGSPKLRVYQIDFGWGRPVKVEVTSIVETGAMSLAESREDVGGVEIGLVLSEEEMNKFGMNFASELVDL